MEVKLERRKKCLYCGHDASKEVLLYQGIRTGVEILVLEVDDWWLQILGRLGEDSCDVVSTEERDFLFSLPTGTPLELIVRVKCGF